MDDGKENPAISGFPEALAYPVVRKGTCGDFILWGLSPSVSPRPCLVRPVYLLNIPATA